MLSSKNLGIFVILGLWVDWSTHLLHKDSLRNCIHFGLDCLTFCLTLQGKNYFWVECSEWPGPNAWWFFRGAMELHERSFFYSLHRQQRLRYPWMGARYALCNLVGCVEGITLSSYDTVLKPLYLESSDKYVGKESGQLCQHCLDRSRKGKVRRWCFLCLFTRQYTKGILSLYTSFV